MCCLPRRLQAALCLQRGIPVVAQLVFALSSAEILRRPLPTRKSSVAQDSYRLQVPRSPMLLMIPYATIKQNKNIKNIELCKYRRWLWMIISINIIEILNFIYLIPVTKEK